MDEAQVNFTDPFDEQKRIGVSVLVCRVSLNRKYIYAK